MAGKYHTIDMQDVFWEDVPPSEYFHNRAYLHEDYLPHKQDEQSDILRIFEDYLYGPLD